MADPSDKGYAPLPPPTDSAPSSAATDSGAGQLQNALQVAESAQDTSSRDLLIIGGVLLVFVIAFFFAKNAYANMLVSRKVAPRSANAAGWWLYILLLSLATIGTLTLVNHVKFLTWFYVLPLVLVAVVSLVLTVVSSRR